MSNAPFNPGNGPTGSTDGGAGQPGGAASPSSDAGQAGGAASPSPGGGLPAANANANACFPSNPVGGVVKTPCPAAVKVTVAIQPFPVACPGHPLPLTAVGTPSGGT